MKSPKDIEVRRLNMELVSMQARMARMEEQLANSVPLDKYLATVAERESLEAELAVSEILPKEGIKGMKEAQQKETDGLHKYYKKQIADKDAEIELLKSDRDRYSECGPYFRPRMWTARSSNSIGRNANSAEAPRL